MRCVLILCLTFWSVHGLPAMSHKDTTPQRDIQALSPCLCAAVAHYWMCLRARYALPPRLQNQPPEGPIHDGPWIQDHPLLQDGCIQAPEGVIELEGPIRLLRPRQGGVLTVQPFLELFGHH